MDLNWDALSAIGTTLAAIVGLVGIWLNLWDKTKKIYTNFETVPSFRIHLSNNSLRTVAITKMVCCMGTDEYVFYVEYFDGLRELTLPPAATHSIDVIKQDVFKSYCETNTCVICNPKDKIRIILYDNYNRKYTIKTNLSIDAFRD